MSFNLTPKEYLDMLIAAWEDFRLNPLSKRYLIQVCTFANHLPEIIFAEYGASNPRKVNNCSTGPQYRAHALGLCPEVGIVRDLCDFGKHGPRLDRKDVEVKETDPKEKVVGNALGLSIFGFPVAQKVEKLVITMNDGRELIADMIVANVVDFWKKKFASDHL
jgi:hypothetical protein